MTFEEKVRSELRWHASAVKDAQRAKLLFKDQEQYNKEYTESEDSAVEQIMKAYHKEIDAIRQRANGV